jgi:hypothetical protein
MTGSELRGMIAEVGKRKRENGCTSDPPGYVYAAYSFGNGTKIGMTCQMNPMKRIRQLNTAVKHPYSLIDFIRCGNPSELEKFMHKQVAHLGVGEHNHELFNMYPNDASTLFQKVQQHIDKMEYSEDDRIDISKLENAFV